MKKKLISIRLSEEVIKTLEFKSKAININKTAYITKSILDSDIKADNSRDIRSLLNAINKIGNNINQIAHTLNIANKNDNLKDVKYDDLLNQMIIIEHHLKDILKGY